MIYPASYSNTTTTQSNIASESPVQIAPEQQEILSSGNVRVGGGSSKNIDAPMFNISPSVIEPAASLSNSVAGHLTPPANKLLINDPEIIPVKRQYAHGDSEGAVVQIAGTPNYMPGKVGTNAPQSTRAGRRASKLAGG